MMFPSIHKSSIPLFDLSHLQMQREWSNECNELWVDVANSFSSSLSKFGFVHLINHGIPQEVIQNAFVESAGFFELSDEQKKKYIKNDPLTEGMHGYDPPGQELLGGRDSVDNLRESFDFWDWRNGKMPTTEIPGFVNSNRNLKEECKKLTRTLLQLIAIALNLEDVDFFIKCHTGVTTEELNNKSFSRNLFRTQHYYPINEMILSKGIDISKTLRCPEHTDYGTVTLLFQDMTGGLQVQNVHQQWVNVDPVENSILINLGDLLEIWSAGLFPATPHRVIIPEEDARRRVPRQSIAFFVNPDDWTTITPLRHSPTKMYSSTTPEAHYKMRIGNSYT